MGIVMTRSSRQADMATTAERWRQLDSLTKWLHTYIHWKFDGICLAVILYLERYQINVSTDSITQLQEDMLNFVERIYICMNVYRNKFSSALTINVNARLEYLYAYSR